MPEPEKLESVPPVITTSDCKKSVDGWERVKVIKLSRQLPRETSELSAIVGGSLSTLIVIFAVLVSAESVASTVRMCCELVS